jgi:hypothetical protein
VIHHELVPLLLVPGVPQFLRKELLFELVDTFLHFLLSQVLLNNFAVLGDLQMVLVLLALGGRLLLRGQRSQHLLLLIEQLLLLKLLAGRALNVPCLVRSHVIIPVTLLFFFHLLAPVLIVVSLSLPLLQLCSNE